MNMAMVIDRPARFSLGQLAATPGALAVFERSGASVSALLSRHQSGDWGEVGAEDWQANEQSLENGWRLLSVYTVAGRKIWIITEADRSATTILLPEEY